MNVQLIECDKIEFFKAEAETRSFSKGFVRRLADSIKAEGMYNPIAVRPNLAKPGYFLGVQGRHRHYAKGKVLKEQFIECNILADMDDVEAALASISENLWRNPLTKAQHRKSLKKWWDYYAAKNPDRVGKGVSGGEATKRMFVAKRAEGHTVADDESVGGNPADRDATEKATSFAEVVSAVTGQSQTSVKRDTRIAKAFDGEQLEVLDQMGVSQGNSLAIAKIKDVVARREVINLVAAGTEPEDALREVLKDKAPKRDTGKSKSDDEYKDNAKKEFECNLSDDEWFDRRCGDKAKLFANPAQHKNDALLFRKLSDQRHAFRSRAKGAIKAAKDSGLAGPLYYLFNRFSSLSHPRDWLICDGCAGKGKAIIDGKKCNKCYGGGFLLKTEIYN